MPQIPSTRQFSKAEIELGWPRMLFALILIIAIAATGARLLIAGYERVLSGRSADLDQEIQDLEKTIPADDLVRLITLDRQIKNIKLLLGTHIYFSKFLDELERLTLSQVRYIIMSASSDKQMVTLSGSAPSMNAVSVQAAAFSKSKNIARLIVKSANTSPAGGVLFDFDIFFVPSLIQPSAK